MDCCEPIEEPLLPRVEAFLRASGMGHSTFGVRAMGDPTFVTRLRNGRDIRWSTRVKVLQFIRDHEARQPIEAG